MSSQSTPQPVETTADSQFLTIGALAKLCDVTVRTLRYYEEMDLIGPLKRSSGKYRLYNHLSLKRVQAILALQSLNFSLEDILTVLGPYSISKTYSKQEQIAHTRESLRRQKDLIAAKVALLDRMNHDLDHRLSLLGNVCTPCLSHDAAQACPDSCNFLEVHD